MSLKVGKAVIAALRSNDSLVVDLGAKGTARTGARIFAVARTSEDDKLDKLPYVIVEPQGITTEGSKDDYEEVDSATVDILCVDKTYPDLVDLTDSVRQTIASYLADSVDEDDNYIITDYTFSAGAVNYDDTKPCFWQTLTFIISTQND